ncbi:MAG: hypothetical protein ABH871_05060 [Pseudomonadota bacterium]
MNGIGAIANSVFIIPLFASSATTALSSIAHSMACGSDLYVCNPVKSFDLKLPAYPRVSYLFGDMPMLGSNGMMASALQTSSGPAPVSKRDDSSLLYPEIILIPLMALGLIYILRVVMNTAWETRIVADAQDEPAKTAQPLTEAGDKVVQV